MAAVVRGVLRGIKEKGLTNFLRELLAQKTARYLVEHRQNYSGEGEELIYHSKGHALNPGQRDWTRFFFPALGGLLYGYDIGATSGAAISLKSSTFSGTTWYNLSSVQTGLVVSGSLYGALIGSALAYTIADFLGRRKELILASISYLIGALLTAAAPNFAIMVVGRFLYGIGIGMAMHAAPMYIAETAPSQIRGMLISLKEFFIVLGMLLGYIAGNLYVEVVSGWRYMWLMLCAIQGKGNLPETKENATRCLCRLRGQASPDLVSEQVNLILEELSYIDQEKQAGFGEIFQGKCLKAMIIGCGLVFFQQVTGQPSVLYYAATIFQSAGFSGASDATRVSILLGLLKLIMTGVAVLVVDRLGRRPLLLGGVSGITVSLFLLSSYYTLLKDVSYVAVIALLLYVGCYQLSFGPIGWLMISEVFPLRLRGRGLSIAVLVNFASNALVTFAFSPLEDLIGTGLLFCGFGVIAVASLVFIFWIVPETKGLTLEEIEASL
ncbi:D-xylose-proton symporter-like 2 [Dichanthelium oligosanthes]|uniref:D-xylose-proton symporter-like 2 n=1 Tax=Dichanthelium oligosanthes TaxID=888268 RepID=A0A1E5W3P6_9POAL|nr:D-xylose-proton symporter-like 2 [Dichanthelium oligosanthes]